MWKECIWNDPQGWAWKIVGKKSVLLLFVAGHLIVSGAFIYGQMFVMASMGFPFHYFIEQSAAIFLMTGILPVAYLFSLRKIVLKQKQAAEKKA